MRAHSPITRQQSPLAVFRHRSFALIWAGRFISTAGSGLTLLAATILVYQYTHSALSIGLLAIASAAPSLLVGLIAGVYVDHFNRRTLMIAADIMRAVLSLLIPLLVLRVPFSAGFHGIIWLYVLTILAQAATQFFEPAFESILPDLATDDELAASNALMMISDFGANGIGFALAGIIAALWPIQWAFYLDALSFVVSAGCLMLTTIPANAPNAERLRLSTVRHNLMEGLHFISDSPTLRSLIQLGFVMYLAFGLSNAILLPFMTKAVHAGSLGYGLEEGITLVGFVTGSLLLASISRRVQSAQLFAVGALGMAVTFALIAGTTSLLVVIILGTFGSFFNSATAICRRLMVQRATPREARGRVSSTFLVVIQVVSMIGMAGAGLADIIDVRLLMLLVAGMLGVAALAALLLPGLRQSADEWRRAVALLRNAELAPGMGAGRVAAITDIDDLVGVLPDVGALDVRGRQVVLSHARIYDAAPGTRVVRQGDSSTAAYFIVHGRVVVGMGSGMNDRPVAVLTTGDFFGEFAALASMPRSANVVTQEETKLVEVPASVLRQMTSYPVLERLLVGKMTQRMIEDGIIEAPRLTTFSAAAAQALAAPPGSSTSRGMLVPEAIGATGPTAKAEMPLAPHLTLASDLPANEARPAASTQPLDPNPPHE